MRYFKATVEYDGTDFAGFQSQHGVRTVQGVLEHAILRRTGQEIRLTGAGRTDAGVHAVGQVISFAAETSIPLDRMALALNGVLAKDVSVRGVEEVDAGFSARFSASARVYAYVILNRPLRSPILHRYAAFCPRALDVSMMQEAANSLIGERDFAAFTNELDESQTTMRDVRRCQVGRYRRFVILRIEGNAFLRGMVRTIAGTLIDVGQGRRPVHIVEDLIASRDRRQAGPSAPPHGLILMKVRYGERKQYGQNRPSPR